MLVLDIWEVSHGFSGSEQTVNVVESKSRNCSFFAAACATEPANIIAIWKRPSRISVGTHSDGRSFNVLYQPRKDKVAGEPMEDC